MIKSLFSIGLTIVCGFSFAQELPVLSPKAQTTQRIGLTDITIEYSRPSVRGREIWGELVPYDELWRAGANQATLFSTSSNIMLNGTALPKGKYSFFIIPGSNGSWDAVFNQDTTLRGTRGYDKELDEVRIGMKDLSSRITSQAPIWSEMLEFHFIDVDFESGYFVMDWGEKRVGFKVITDPMAIAMDKMNTESANIPEEEMWEYHTNLADLAYKTGDNELGLSLIDRSMKMDDQQPSSYTVKARLLKAEGDEKGAQKSAKTAVKLLDDEQDKEEISRLKKEFGL